MRRAFCTQDGVVYEAADFYQVKGFETKKRFLECTECHGPAYYRGATRNGREACFGARPHAAGCTMATLEHDGVLAGPGDEADEIITTGQRIVVDLNFGAPEGGQDHQPVEVTIPVVGEVVRGGGGPAIRERMTRRLGPLLRSLIESEAFRRSNLPIEIPEMGEFVVSDFFVNFTDVADNHLDSYKGFWGMVVDARVAMSNGSLWFNSGGRENLSVYLDQAEIGAAFGRFNITEEEDIAGAYILVLGVLKRTQGNGKRYVGITSPANFTVRLAR